MIIPSVALASWWNPFTWFRFNKTEKTEIIQIATSTIQVTETGTSTKNTLENNVKPNVTQNTQTLESKTATPFITQNCSSIQDLKQRDICYVALAKVQKDPVICNSIVDLTKRDSCYIYLAYLKNDSDLCNFLVEKSNEDKCHNLTTNELENEKSILITQFLNNPTLENFKVFCANAKKITGSKIEKTMDSSRENLVTTNLSFYYDIRDCKNLDANDGVYYLPLDTNLLISLKSSDSDLEREAKLLYNEKINNLISTSVIRFVLFRGQESIKTPKELWSYYLSMTNGDGSTSNEKIRNIQSFPDVVSDLSMTFKTLKLKYSN